MSKFTVEHIDRADFPRWDGYVMEHPDGTVYHTTRWLEGSNRDVTVIVCQDRAGDIAGGIALVKTVKYGVRGYHLPPFTPYFGPLFTPSGRQLEASARADNLELVQSILTALPRAANYEFMLTPGPFDLLPYIWNGFQIYPRYSYILQGSYDDFTSRMVKGKLRELKQAHLEMEEGTLAVSEDAPIDDFLELLRETKDVTGLKVDEAGFRKRFAFDPEREHWKLFIVKEKGGEPVAGAVALHTPRRATVMLTAVSSRHRTSRNSANLLAYDAMARFCLESGRLLDFSGSIVPGIERFFRLIGGEQVIRYHLRKSPSPLMFLLRCLHQYRQEIKGSRMVE